MLGAAPDAMSNRADIPFERLDFILLHGTVLPRRVSHILATVLIS